jgi:adenine-specific DNA methylase
LDQWIPKFEIPFGHSTHERNDIVSQGYTHWYKMFNHRQLYVHALLMKTISESPQEIASDEVKSHALGAFQNYLRHNCMFSIWDISRDGLAPHFSNNNYHPKATPIENGVFSDLGRGNFASCIQNVGEGLQFAQQPYDLRVSRSGESGKSSREPSNEEISPQSVRLFCQSSTNLSQQIPNGSVDLVITDPPFGDNLNYSELADFFLVWLQRPLSKIFPDVFQSPESPKRLEAVANKARHPGNTDSGERKADVEYDRLLTLCWREAHRILKPGGLMAFTFHHDKDIAWIGVLDSLFKAGFIIEGTFPIRSDATKGDGDFGSKKIEFDIVHVCRKRLQAPPDIYWATLRKRISDSVNAKKVLLEQHHKAGLGKADLEVMIRGEVLQQYSKHYGAVKKNIVGDLMNVQEILIAAGEIARQLLAGEQVDRLPDSVSPATSVYFSLFRDGPTIEFNQAKMRLKGCGISLEELESYGWLEIVREDGQKFAKIIPAEKRWNVLSQKKKLSFDLDQVHFALNCFMSKPENEADRPELDTWATKNFETLFPSVIPLLKFLKGSHFGKQYRLQIDPAIRAIEKGIALAKAEYKGPETLIG